MVCWILDRARSGGSGMGDETTNPGFPSVILSYVCTARCAGWTDAFEVEMGFGGLRRVQAVRSLYHRPFF